MKLQIGSGMALLTIKDVSKNFDGLAVLRDCQLEVRDSEIVGIIGPNGAGKTTLFNIICGFVHPTKGNVLFRGEEITNLKPYQIAQKGIGRTFQMSTLFNRSTVFNNVLTGFHTRYGNKSVRDFVRPSSSRQVEDRLRVKASEILDFTGLSSQKDKLAENLSTGNQKLLAISVALAMEPKLLLLDEPVTTLSQDKVDKVMTLIRRIKESGTTVVIIEHNMRAIMDHCDRIAVLAYGSKIFEGSPVEVRESKEVAEAYLGEMD
jgi:branched-chain amino acid transport system ATP-binding protein